MCYQVIERFLVCRCLYYRHSIEPCAACGQRSHTVQEKTVLVGYACPAHTEPVRDDAEYNSSTEGSDEEESVFSAAAVPYTAESLITDSDEDTIDEIIRILLEDSLLDWPGLANVQSGSSEYIHKDVRFFLTKYISDLREIADTPIKLQTCAYIRSRIRYLSSQVCERFDITECTTRKGATMNNRPGTTLEQLQPVTLKDDDLVCVPPFRLVRSYLFDGDPYAALKGNVKLYGSKYARPRDFVAEMADIICKNACSVDGKAMCEAMEKDHLGDMTGILAIFLKDILCEAFQAKISEMDASGIAAVANNVEDLETKLRSFWCTRKPAWYYYPLMPESGNLLEAGRIACSLENTPLEAFRNYVTSSRVFSALLNAIISYTSFRRIDTKPRLWSRITNAFHNRNFVGPGILGHGWVRFECVGHPRSGSEANVACC
jgi:hypothetical protein